MAGIYFPGVEMPKKCIRCPFVVFGHCSANHDKDIEKVVADAKRDDECPIIPVPDHGRLIDADKLIWRLTPDEAFYPTEAGRFEYDNGRLMIRDIRSFIRCQPTIIPAEEGEE